MKVSPIVLAIASVVSATKVTYYSDNSCQSEIVTEDIEFEQCTDLFTAEHPNVESIQFKEITGAKKATGYWNDVTNNCDSHTAPQTFEVGKCEPVVDQKKYQVLKPEVILFFKNDEKCGSPDAEVPINTDGECHSTGLGRFGFPNLLWTKSNLMESHLRAFRSLDCNDNLGGPLLPINMIECKEDVVDHIGRYQSYKVVD